MKQTHLKQVHKYKKRRDGRGKSGDEEKSDASDSDVETLFDAEFSYTLYIS